MSETPEASPSEGGSEERDLRDMGGSIGPASIQGSSDRGGPRDPEAAGGAFAEEVSMADAGVRAEVLAGTDDTGDGDNAPPVVPGKSNYVDIDPLGETQGVGAAGETDALLEQKRRGGP